jgi:hypothetical protein
MRFCVASVTAAILALVVAVSAGFADSPRFIRASASFDSPDLLVSYQEAGLGSRPAIPYELDGRREVYYECADGSTAVSIVGPVLDESTGASFPSEPPLRVFLTSSGGLISGSLAAQPWPPIQFNGSAFGPIACANGQPPVLTVDQFKDLTVIDTANNVSQAIPGQFGFCNPIGTFFCGGNW